MPLTLYSTFASFICMCTMSPKLEDMFSECGVSPNLASDLLAEGWTTTTFAFTASDESGFDQSLTELCASHGDTSLLQKAALRAAWHAARRSQIQEPSSSTPASEPAQSSDAPSWTEAFAPKMEQATVQKLKDAYLANYPSELLTPDLMPSLRLLSLVYSQLQKKQWRWVPWKYRMSSARAEEVQGQRLPKVPKLEGMQLHSLLIDEPPTLEINSSTMGVNASGTCLKCTTVLWQFAKERTLPISRLTLRNLFLFSLKELKAIPV